MLIIAVITLTISLIGIGVILFRKIPMLLELSPSEKDLSNWKDKIKEVPFPKTSSLKKPFVKIASHFSSKEKKSDLEEEQTDFSDNYWEELKKSDDPSPKKTIKVEEEDQ